MEHIIYQSAPADPNEDGFFVVDTATGFPVAGPFDRMTRAETELSARADARKTTEVGTPEWAADITAEQAVELPYRHYKMWRDIKQAAKETDTLRRTGWDFTPKS